MHRFIFVAAFLVVGSIGCIHTPSQHYGADLSTVGKDFQIEKGQPIQEVFTYFRSKKAPNPQIIPGNPTQVVYREMSTDQGSMSLFMGVPGVGLIPGAVKPIGDRHERFLVINVDPGNRVIDYSVSDLPPMVMMPTAQPR